MKYVWPAALLVGHACQFCVVLEPRDWTRLEKRSAIRICCTSLLKLASKCLYRHTLTTIGAWSIIVRVSVLNQRHCTGAETGVEYKVVAKSATDLLISFSLASESARILLWILVWVGLAQGCELQAYLAIELWSTISSAKQDSIYFNLQHHAVQIYCDIHCTKFPRRSLDFLLALIANAKLVVRAG